MPLILTIRNAASLSNGSPLTLTLDRRGAIIGRSATSDWCLPDPALHISSRHCEVRFEGDRYHLVDHSTNGTFLLGESARLAAPRAIDQGDVFVVGEFEIEASLDEASAARLAAERAAAAGEAREWQGWNAAGGAAPAPPPPAIGGGWGPSDSGASVGGWGAPPPPAAGRPPAPGAAGWGAAAPAPPSPPSPGGSGWGAAPRPGASGGWGADAGTPAASPPAASGGWGASVSPVPGPAPSLPPSGGGWGPAAGPAPASSAGWAPARQSADPPKASPWDSGAKDEAIPASSWSSPVSSAPPAQSSDVWGKIAQSNVVDWARGGFGNTAPASPQPSGPPASSVAAANFTPPRLVADGATAPGPEAAPPVPPQPSGQALSTLARAAGIEPDKLGQDEAATIGQAGDLLRRLVAGLVVMMEARARAKAQLGAQGTSLEFDGNNPLKFARSPEQALAQLLNPPQRGFMPTERAVEDAFKDLQAHQVATLMAMQGALRATLDRFSPKAIRSRAESGGLLAKVLPGAKEAALWKAYEKEFSGVAQGSDEAFMDVFAKEFKKAYEEVARQK